MVVTQRVEIEGRALELEVGEGRQAGRWGLLGAFRRDGRAGHGVLPQGHQGGRGLPPAHGRLSREHLRRRSHPRRLLQARGSPDREGDPDLAFDRPAVPAPLPEGLHPRDSDHRVRAFGRWGQRSGRPGDQRRLGGAHGLGVPVRHAGGRGPRGAGRGRAGRQPDAPAARGRGAGDRGRRHRGRGRDGGGRGARRFRGPDPRRHRPRPPRDQEDHRRPAPAQGRGRQAQARLGTAGRSLAGGVRGRGQAALRRPARRCAARARQVRAGRCRRQGRGRRCRLGPRGREAREGALGQGHLSRHGQRAVPQRDPRQG